MLNHALGLRATTNIKLFLTVWIHSWETATSSAITNLSSPNWFNMIRLEILTLSKLLGILNSGEVFPAVSFSA